ncbi:hypothetical protein [Pedobacter sp. GR22-6]|uniref:hypothetical protein n=1 Tax=Pedobacter sp. GR22-6 TaxID=3127957 RepID=UPI00307E1152
MPKKLNIERIWWRSVQPGEFYNIERYHRISGGGGSLYIEIPNSMVHGTLDFLDLTEAGFNSLSSFTIQASVVGDHQVSGPIEFRSKAGGRMRIANQNRQQPNTQRHPAWTSMRNFPRAPDDVATREEAMEYFPDGGLRIYIAKTFDGKYYAGFTKGHRPPHMTDDHPMFELYSNKVGGIINS